MDCIVAGPTRGLTSGSVCCGVAERSLVQFETPENRDGMSIVCARVELFFTYAHRASWQTNEPWVDRDVTIGGKL